MKRIKVLHIISSLCRGGGQLLLSNLVSSHDENKIEAIVISLTEGGVVGERIRAHNIPVIELNFSFGFCSITSMYKLISLIKKYNPDVVQTWMYHADLVGGLGATLAGVKKIIWGIHHADPRVNKIPTKIIARFCGIISGVLPVKIVACSSLAADSHAQFGYSHKRMVIIENGVNLSKFYHNRVCRSEGKGGEVIVGHVARWHPVKGHEVFIQAAGLLHRRLPKTRFVMVGKGINWDNPILVSWIKKAGIFEVTELHGDRSDMPDVMNLFDVYVSSSKSESFSLTLVEALACGVPCVSTKTGIAEDLLSESVKVSEVDDFCQMASLIEDFVRLPAFKRQQIGVNSVDLIKSRFDEREMIAKYEQLYQQVIS